MMFYLVTPNETTFETAKEVPDYVLKVRMCVYKNSLRFHGMYVDSC